MSGTSDIEARRAGKGRSAPARGAPAAVIFDHDGVIADTEWLHFECFRKVAGEEGIAIEREDHDARFLGINDRAAFTMAFGEVGRSLAGEACDRLIERKSRYYRSRLGEIRLYPGVEALLEALAARVPLAIGSGGRRFEIESVLEANGIRRHFAAVLSADEVLRSKPAPDIYLAALEALRAAAPPGRREILVPSACLVIEDAVPGIEAARAAGMPCLAVAHTYPPDRLSGAGRVVARIGDLTAEEVLDGAV